MKATTAKSAKRFSIAEPSAVPMFTREEVKALTARMKERFPANHSAWKRRVR